MISASIIKPNLSKGTLSKLTDTSISSPSNGQVLGYNSTTSKWENQTLSGGSTVSKTRYQISSSSWSSSANSDGYYTATKTLSPTIGSSPDVYVAGSADGTEATDTQRTQFSYVKRCKVNGSTLTLYASSKPSSTFYIWVEGVNGTGSGDIVGNVIQSNGESSGGGSYTLWGTVTFTKSDFTAQSDPSRYASDKNDTTIYDRLLNSGYNDVNIIVRASKMSSYWDTFFVAQTSCVINAIKAMGSVPLQIFLPISFNTGYIAFYVTRQPVNQYAGMHARISSDLYNGMDSNSKIEMLFYVK